jgi:hypothetical protein
MLRCVVLRKTTFNNKRFVLLVKDLLSSGYHPGWGRGGWNRKRNRERKVGTLGTSHVRGMQ